MKAKITQGTVDQLGRAFRKVSDIDRAIVSLKEDRAHKAADYGEKFRNTLGQSRMNWTTTDDLGHRVLTAVISEFLKLRAEIVSKHDDIADFPDPPAFTIERETAA